MQYGINNIFFKNAQAKFFVILVILVASGCEKKAIEQRSKNFQRVSQGNSNFYLHKMSQTLDNTRTHWKLLTILTLLKENKVQQAIVLFKELPRTLSNTQLKEKLLLSAELKIARKNYISAKKILDTIDFNQLNRNQQMRFWQASIDSEQRLYPLTKLRALIWQEPFLNHKDRQKNIDYTWKVLTSITPKQASQLFIKSNENILQGWLDLLQIWLINRNNIEMLQTAIHDWKTRYPHNPGAKMLPTQLVTIQNFHPISSIKRIALLLPLNGQAGVFGRAIQQGFEAAKNSVYPVTTTKTIIKQVTDSTNVDNIVNFSTRKNNKIFTLIKNFVQKNEQNFKYIQKTLKSIRSVINTKLQSNNRISIKNSNLNIEQPRKRVITTKNINSDVELKIYDTNTQSLDQILYQIQQDNISVVVGPLLKRNVKKITTSNVISNILVLNQIKEVQNHHNICYFSLSPEDEARDAARHIYEQNKRSPLLLIPRSTLGNRITQAFVEEWQKLSNGIVLQQTFGSLDELHTEINQGKGISLTGIPVKSSLRKQHVSIGGLTMSPILGDRNISTNNKVDAVYIAATQEEISFIKPMIVMYNGNLNNIALYTSSRSIQDNIELDFRLEMDGLQYSEIPLLAYSKFITVQRILAEKYNNYALVRLYAMGADAWILANHFNQIRQIPGYGLNGNTGYLTANENCVIQRKLSWLQYHQGKIVLVR